MRFAGSSSFADRLKRGVDVSALAGSAMNADSEERINALQTEYQVAGAGLDSLGQVKSAAHQARAIEAGGQAQAAATRSGGISSMIGSIAGGIGSLDFSGGSSSTSSWQPSFNAYTPQF